MIKRNDNNDDRSISWGPILASAVVTATAIGVGIFLLKSVPQYGWEGTMRYIWEGDAYSPELRDLADTLEDAEIARSLQESRIHAMEAALDLARLNSIEGQSSTEIVKNWVDCFAAEADNGGGGQSLEQVLADVSDKLDKIAAKIDGVALSSTMSNNNNKELVERIQLRKKLLSKNIVLDMERCDVLLGSYQVLREQN
jgi:hypothetical protein